MRNISRMYGHTKKGVLVVTIYFADGEKLTVSLLAAALAGTL